MYGVGYHHAGLSTNDRKTIETMFTNGELPVLFSTSTLAMGVSY
jgi:ATP-dependent DNA helicase HFM1/MER3